jgi:hypothetical protein
MVEALGDEADRIACAALADYLVMMLFGGSDDSDELLTIINARLGQFGWKLGGGPDWQPPPPDADDALSLAAGKAE